MTPTINRLLVVGLGLIGGSLAKAARERGLCREVIGSSRNPDTLSKALASGVVDRVITDIGDVAGDLGEGDVVLVGVPTLTVPDIMHQLQPLLADSVTVTDVASVKGSVVTAVRRAYGKMPAQFVPGHPIAGSEKSGVDAANSGLFDEHRVILTLSLIHI